MQQNVQYFNKFAIEILNRNQPDIFPMNFNKFSMLLGTSRSTPYFYAIFEKQ